MNPPYSYKWSHHHQVSQAKISGVIPFPSHILSSEEPISSSKNVHGFILFLPSSLPLFGSKPHHLLMRFVSFQLCSFLGSQADLGKCHSDSQSPSNPLVVPIACKIKSCLITSKLRLLCTIGHAQSSSCYFFNVITLSPNHNGLFSPPRVRQTLNVP